MKLVLVGFHITVADEVFTFFNVRPHILEGSTIKMNKDINKEKNNA